MQTKKIVINFNYPDDADISLEEIQDKITKVLNTELGKLNVAWEICEETALPFLNPTPPSYPYYPSYPTNPCEDEKPHWVQPGRFWWHNQPTCLNQEDVAKLKSLLKKNDNDKKA